MKIYISGMSESTISKSIMIYKLNKVFKTRISLEEHNITSDYKISKLLNDLKNEKLINFFEKNYIDLKNFNWETVYIKYKKAFISLQSDKIVSEILNFLKNNKIELIYIKVTGGASIHNTGYTFTVHSNEEIHKNNPHVHVVKDSTSVRYSLRTFKRFPNDKCPREYKRDEKKIIIPTLKKNKAKLWDFWKCSTGGFIPTVIDKEGNEYYKES